VRVKDWANGRWHAFYTASRLAVSGALEEAADLLSALRGRGARGPAHRILTETSNEVLKWRKEGLRV
jgi:hypothetical protein